MKVVVTGWVGHAGLVFVSHVNAQGPHGGPYMRAKPSRDDLFDRLSAELRELLEAAGVEVGQLVVVEAE